VSPPGFEPTVDETIKASPRAPGEARRAVEQVAPHVDAGVLRDTQLLVSEVVTNSIRHSGSDDPIQLRVWARSNGLKVEIADGGDGFNAAAMSPHATDEGGRGLMIVDALADRWGVTNDARARVWFELSPRPVSRAQAG
jgi:anti-sigma regulatory factor (Ser/Thr protein kinase)